MGSRWDDYNAGVFSAFPYPIEARPERADHLRQHFAQVGLTPRDFAGARVLDAGCGTGLTAAVLRTWGARIVGCDLSAGALHHARARGLPAVRATLAALPFARIDIAVCLGVLHHVDAPPHALRELLTTLRPGGQAVISWAHPFGCLRYHLAVNLLLTRLCGLDLERRLRVARWLNGPWRAWARQRRRHEASWAADWYGASYRWLTPRRLLGGLGQAFTVEVMWPPWTPLDIVKTCLVGNDRITARLRRAAD